MVFKREDALKSIADGLAWLAASCKLRGSLHLFDNNVLSHHFFCRLLNEMYGFKLVAMDRIQSNYPAIDLGDTENRIAYQVTTEKSGAKVQHTLNKFVEQELQAKFNKLKVLVIGERQARYTALSIPKEIAFAPDKDIIDLTDLVKDAEGLTTPSLEKLALIFDEELSQVKRQSNQKAAPLNQVLWLLDNEIESRKFERLCTDLMCRAGYTEIEPYGGTHDRGRDAETRIFKGTASTGGIVFFQYSQEGRWERKLLNELKKVQKNEHKIVAFVFVSSRAISGAARDKLKKTVAKQYGWELIIHEREWFRLQLEECHPDLAVKYLGFDPTSHLSLSPIQSKPPSGPEDHEKKAWQLYRIEDYDGAAVEFKRWVSKHGNDLPAWQALAWCQYRLYRYQEALVSIGRALALDGENTASLTIKASILTEDGIVKDARPNLVMARDIFAQLARTSNQWVDHYNYANVLSGLGEYDAARDEYLKAISVDPKQAMVWKNLAAVWAYLGNHKKEATCLDTSLRLNPHLAEALVSKGIRLVVGSNQADDGIALIERAITEDENAPVRWPHLYYWLATGYHALGKLKTTLQRIDTGLSITPYHAALLNLKGRVLAEAWRKDRSFLPQAKAFFHFLVEASPGNYPALEELARIVCAVDGDDGAWSLIDKLVTFPGVQAASTFLKMVGYSLNDALIGFRFLTTYKPFWEESKTFGFVEDLKQQEITKDDTFRDALFLVCAVSFGLVCDQFATTPKVGRKLSRVKAIIWAASATLERVIPRLTSLLSPGVVMESLEAMADGSARIVLALYHIALLEVSGQVGYAAGLFRVDAAVVDKAMPRSKQIDEWLARITEEILILLKKDLRFTPD